MEKSELKAAFSMKTPAQCIDFAYNAIEESYNKGFMHAEQNMDPPVSADEDSAVAIDFALNQLKEAKERGLSIDDLIQDLTIRSCRFMANPVKLY